MHLIQNLVKNNKKRLSRGGFSPCSRVPHPLFGFSRLWGVPNDVVPPQTLVYKTWHILSKIAKKIMDVTLPNRYTDI